MPFSSSGMNLTVNESVLETEFGVPMMTQMGSLANFLLDIFPLLLGITFFWIVYKKGAGWILDFARSIGRKKKLTQEKKQFNFQKQKAQYHRQYEKQLAPATKTTTSDFANKYSA